MFFFSNAHGNQLLSSFSCLDPFILQALLLMNDFISDHNKNSLSFKYIRKQDLQET